MIAISSRHVGQPVEVELMFRRTSVIFAGFLHELMVVQLLGEDGLPTGECRLVGMDELVAVPPLAPQAGDESAM